MKGIDRIIGGSRTAADRRLKEAHDRRLRALKRVTVPVWAVPYVLWTALRGLWTVLVRLWEIDSVKIITVSLLFASPLIILIIIAICTCL